MCPWIRRLHLFVIIYNATDYFYCSNFLAHLSRANLIWLLQFHAAIIATHFLASKLYDDNSWPIWPEASNSASILSQVARFRNFRDSKPTNQNCSNWTRILFGLCFVFNFSHNNNSKCELRISTKIAKLWAKSRAQIKSTTNVCVIFQVCVCLMALLLIWFHLGFCSALKWEEIASNSASRSKAKQTNISTKLTMLSNRQQRHFGEGKNLLLSLSLSL